MSKYEDPSWSGKFHLIWIIVTLILLAIAFDKHGWMP